MKKIVNIHYIKRLFDPLFQLEDDEIDKLSHLNLDNEIETKEFIKKNLLPN